MTRSTKTILIAAGILGLLCVIACVTVYVAVRLGGNALSQAMVTDPAKVSQIAHGIVDYELPAGYREMFAMTILGYQTVEFSPENIDGSLIMMMQLSGYSANVDEKSLAQQLQRQMGAGSQGFTAVSTKTETVTIRGQETTTTIREGQTAQGAAATQLSCVFKGKAGTVILMIFGTSSQWDQASVDSFLSSLK